MDDETESLLDENADDNHSDIVRELLKEYYTAGVYDVEEAARRARKKELQDRLDRLDQERELLAEELEQIEATTDETEESTIEEVAEDLSIRPENVSKENPAIKQKAKANGIDAAVLADVVMEQSLEDMQSDYKSGDRVTQTLTD